MLLEQKTAVIYGAGGAVGGAVARAFARDGARVFLTGHTRPPLDELAQDVSQAGGVAEEVSKIEEVFACSGRSRGRRAKGTNSSVLHQSSRLYA